MPALDFPRDDEGHPFGHLQREADRSPRGRGEYIVRFASGVWFEDNTTFGIDADGLPGKPRGSEKRRESGGEWRNSAAKGKENKLHPID